MKRLFLTTALLSAIAPALISTAQADQQGRETLYKSWSLTATQQQHLEQAQQQFDDTMASLTSQSFGSRQARHQALEDAVKTHRQALANILDQEQLKALAAYQHQFNPRQAKQAFKHALFDSWELGDAQKSRLETAQSDFRTAVEKSRELDQDKRGEAKKAAVADYRQALNDILTPAQNEVLRTLRQFRATPSPHDVTPMVGARALISSWHLTDTQQKALTEANNALKTQLENLQPHRKMGPMDQHPKGERGEEHTNHQDMSADQQDQDGKPPHEMDQKRGKGKKSPDHFKPDPKVKAVFQAHEKALEHILSPEQMAALALFKPAPMHGPGPGTPMKGHGPDHQADNRH